jgi:hypothetical protein
MEPDPKLVDDWIASQFLDLHSAEYELLAYAGEASWDMARHRPDEAWEFILAVLKANQSSRVLESLSAGPLEDLLANHGPYVIDRVEATARTNVHFARLLGGVWRSTMTADVWERVQSVWDRRGWDGIPAAT